MNTADRIKRLRMRWELTAEEFGKITEIHPVSIRKYETNKMVPGMDIIDKMCNRLELPRMIFEGFPKQYTDYHFKGDFYQQLFLLLDNKTLSVNKENESDVTFSLNPELANYMTIKHGDDIIPLDQISFQIRDDTLLGRLPRAYARFLEYLELLDEIEEVKNSDTWTDSEQTKEEYLEDAEEDAEVMRFDLMLDGHYWTKYMPVPDTQEEVDAALGEEYLNGGDFYSFVEKLNAPMSFKQMLYETNEEEYIREKLNIPEDPLGDEYDPKAFKAWMRKFNALVRKYKREHPDYEEILREMAAKDAQEYRDEYYKKHGK